MTESEMEAEANSAVQVVQNACCEWLHGYIVVGFTAKGKQAVVVGNIPDPMTAAALKQLTMSVMRGGLGGGSNG